MSERNFVYCENEEGGMSVYELGDKPPVALRGWMDPMCKKQDEALVEWMKSAKVGQYTDHRLGTIFCVLGSEATPA